MEAGVEQGARGRGDELEKQLVAGPDDGEGEAADAAEGADDDAGLAIAVVDPNVVMRAGLLADGAQRAHDVVVTALAVDIELAIFGEELNFFSVH